MQTDYKESQELKELLHLMKGVEPFSVTLRELTRTRKQWCPFTHKGIKLDINCYRLNPSIKAVTDYINKFAICCRYLDCHPYVVEHIEEACKALALPERMSSLADFETVVEKVRDYVKTIEADISSKLDRFTCLECSRLDEAIECLRNYCFRSSVVLAVSAVEARISEIVRRYDKSLYDSTFAQATLGQLVQLFNENQYTDDKFTNLKKLMPEKHKPLVSLLNQYRVFSAHPKDERITLQTAETILKLSFMFMIDPATCPYEKEELQCKK